MVGKLERNSRWILIVIFALTVHTISAQSIPNLKLPLAVSHLSGYNKYMLMRAGAPKHHAFNRAICFKFQCRGVIGWRKTQQRNKFKGYKKGPAIPRLKYLKNDSLKVIESQKQPSQKEPLTPDTTTAPSSPIIQKDSTLSFTFNDVLFETNRSDLKREFIARLDTLSASLDKYSNYRIRIVGHTDNSGVERENSRLSQERAEAVASYLELLGINRDVITAEGMGSRSPIADNATAEGRKKNRRVEIFLSFQ